MAGKKNGRQATRGGNGGQKPAWLWVLIGMLLGVGLMLVVLGKDWAPLLRKKNLPQPNPEATAPRESEPPLAEAKPPPKKNYDFYQVLPEAEVVIPDAELSAKAKAEKQAQQARTNPAAPSTTPGAATPGTTAAPAAGGRYVLQTSSYPDPKAADEAKAKLALAGFSAQVQPVTINGKTWHRVRLGPYASASALEAAKKSLAENGINAIALKEQPAQ